MFIQYFVLYGITIKFITITEKNVITLPLQLQTERSNAVINPL